MDVDELREQMRRPESYPADSPRAVRLIETHISLVALTGAHAYKVKKPVNLGFCDFTTLEGRRAACIDEVRLNRRLAPELYLGVVPIVYNRALRRVRFGDEDACGAASDNARGEVVEWAVKMREVPQASLMTEQLGIPGAVRADVIDAIAARLARFYAHEAARGPDVDHYGHLETIRTNVEENFAQTEPMASSDTAAGGFLRRGDFERIGDATRSFLKEYASLFERRVIEGRIVEGHGDLHSANIFLVYDEGDAPYEQRPYRVHIFDCVEFSARLRCGDVASDASYLAMDLDYHSEQRSGLGDRFVRQLALQSGDLALLKLTHFYRCYRAYVRGKVRAMTLRKAGTSHNSASVDQADGADVGQHPDAVAARRYFSLALAYADCMERRDVAFVQPIVVLMCGLSGSGKSYIARYLARWLALTIVATDAVRQESAALLADGAPASSAGHKYSIEQRDRVYGLVIARAMEIVGDAAHGVVLDATFLRRRQRADAIAAARARGGLPIVVYIAIGLDAATERLEGRAQRARLGVESVTSEAVPAILPGQQRDLELPDASEGAPCVVVDAGRGEGSEEAYDRLVERLREHILLPQA